MPTKNTPKKSRVASARTSIAAIVSTIAALGAKAFSAQVHLRGTQERVVSAITQLTQSGKVIVNTVSVGLRLRAKDVSLIVWLRGDHEPVVSAVTHLGRSNTIATGPISTAISLRGNRPTRS